jgi:hypothetical protein
MRLKYLHDGEGLEAGFQILVRREVHSAIKQDMAVVNSRSLASNRHPLTDRCPSKVYYGGPYCRPQPSMDWDALVCHEWEWPSRSLPPFLGPFRSVVARRVPAIKAYLDEPLLCVYDSPCGYHCRMELVVQNERGNDVRRYHTFCD